MGTSSMRKSFLLIATLAVVLSVSGLAAAITPAAHASPPSESPQYIVCSRLGPPFTHYGSTQTLGNGDTAQPSITAWHDSVQSTTVCQEQANVLWTTHSCSGRSVTVGFTNGVGGNKTTGLSCGTFTYTSYVTYSGDCTFYMSATTSDYYQITWSSGGFC